MGGEWRHDVTIDYPSDLKHRKTALLFVTGGKPNAADQKMTRELANDANMPVVTLYQIPNQPIWGRNEDDLIAHTFEQFLKTGDTNWPLLFPMAKSVVSAMDAAQAALKGTSTPVGSFIVFGASKRGWTTWISAASGDSRIAGIAPCVFDNLNFKAQLDHQFKSWGFYSEMIGDYTNRGLQDIVDSPPGKRLLSLVDPYSYVGGIACPVLIVNGANDRYWSVDSLSLYSGALKMPWAACVVPNAGHELGDGKTANSAIAAFAAACAGEFKFSDYSVVLNADRRRVQARSGKKAPVSLALWTAWSSTLDFRNSKWSPHVARASHTLVTAPVVSAESNSAVMAVAEFVVRGRRFTVTSGVRVLKGSRLGR
jgi:PhoPQ-activated pathogenicity-related protein